MSLPPLLQSQDVLSTKGPKYRYLKYNQVLPQCTKTKILVT